MIDELAEALMVAKLGSISWDRSQDLFLDSRKLQSVVWFVCTLLSVFFMVVWKVSPNR